MVLNLKHQLPKLPIRCGDQGRRRLSLFTESSVIYSFDIFFILHRLSALFSIISRSFLFTLFRYVPLLLLLFLLFPPPQPVTGNQIGAWKAASPSYLQVVCVLLTSSRPPDLTPSTRRPIHITTFPPFISSLATTQHLTTIHPFSHPHFPSTPPSASTPHTDLLHSFLFSTTRHLLSLTPLISTHICVSVSLFPSSTPPPCFWSRVPP